MLLGIILQELKVFQPSYPSVACLADLIAFTIQVYPLLIKEMSFEVLKTLHCKKETCPIQVSSETLRPQELDNNIQKTDMSAKLEEGLL